MGFEAELLLGGLGLKQVSGTEVSMLMLGRDGVPRHRLLCRDLKLRSLHGPRS